MFPFDSRIICRFMLFYMCFEVVFYFVFCVFFVYFVLVFLLLLLLFCFLCFFCFFSVFCVFFSQYPTIIFHLSNLAILVPSSTVFFRSAKQQLAFPHYGRVSITGGQGGFEKAFLSSKCWAFSAANSSALVFLAFDVDKALSYWKGLDMSSTQWSVSFSDFRATPSRNSRVSLALV